jgi:co-chaperonin GroES (HSP10)
LNPRLIPLGERILLKREEGEKKYGRIWLPETCQRPPAEGRIIAVGPAVVNEHLKPGTKVIFGKYSGVEIGIDIKKSEDERPIRENFLFVNEENIIAIIEYPPNGNQKPASYDDLEESVTENAINFRDERLKMLKENE